MHKEQPDSSRNPDLALGVFRGARDADKKRNEISISRFGAESRS